tara:strand:+ start:2418 stop:2909 length:492 start_codon:yes stop_codon:yes gene_type:complete
MSSTIQTAGLTIVHTEAWTLNDGTHEDTVNSSNTQIITNVADIYKRTILITTSEVTLLTFSAAAAQAGHFVAADVKYMRFTNKDNTNFITLTFRNQDNDEVAIKLDKGQSFIWNGDLTDGMVDVFNATQDADAASDTALGDLTNIQADANSGSCHLEVFVACT